MRAFAHDPGEPHADDPPADTSPADSRAADPRAAVSSESNSREVNPSEVISRGADPSEVISREVDPSEADSGGAGAARDEAWLLVQSPRRLFFYWRFARDPRPALVAALGDAAAKLRLSVRLVEPGGDWEGEPAAVGEDGDDTFWFDVLPGRAYRAEVGFHAEGLPFVRLLSSGAVETPAPSDASDASVPSSRPHATSPARRGEDF
jgi:hypothetical protein